MSEPPLEVSRSAATLVRPQTVNRMLGLVRPYEARASLLLAESSPPSCPSRWRLEQLPTLYFLKRGAYDQLGILPGGGKAGLRVHEQPISLRFRDGMESVQGWIVMLYKTN